MGLISRVNNADYIAILATLTAIDNKEKFYCETCLGKYCGRPDEKAMTQKNRELKGCFGIKKNPIHTLSVSEGKDSIKFSTCVGNFFDWTVLSLLEMQRLYDKGILPYPGSLSNQPNKIIEAFTVIEKYKYEKAERDRKTRELKERGKRGR